MEAHHPLRLLNKSSFWQSSEECLEWKLILTGVLDYFVFPTILQFEVIGLAIACSFVDLGVPTI